MNALRMFLYLVLFATIVLIATSCRTITAEKATPLLSLYAFTACEVIIQGDEAKIYRHRLSGSDAPYQIELPIADTVDVLMVSACGSQAFRFKTAPYFRGTAWIKCDESGDGIRYREG